MNSGTITTVDPDRRGGTLKTGTVPASESIGLEDATDFDEDGGWLVIADGEPLQYTGLDDESNIVYLAGIAGGTYEAGLPVDIWDPTVAPAGARMVEYLATVQTDDGQLKALVPHELIPAAGVENLEGAACELSQTEEGSWYVSQVLGREMVLDLSTADPESAPPELGGGSGPTDPPASSPTLTTAGSKDAITVVAHGVIDPTTVLDYYLDGTLIESTRSAVIVARSDAAGDPLQPETDYTFHVVARNDQGSAAASPTVTAQLNLAVDSQAILAVVTAGFALLGQLDVGGITIKPPTGTPGQPGYDSGGIIIPLTSGGEIRFPADGSQALIEAALRTADLIVSGGLQVNGQTNYVNGTLFLGSGTPDPATATVIGSTILTKDQKLFKADGSNAGIGYNYHRGLAKMSNGKVAIISAKPNSAVKDLRVFDPANGWKQSASTDSDTEFLDFRSVAAIGNKLYVLGQRWNAGAGESQWRIQVYDANLASTAESRWLESTGGVRLVSIDYYDGSIAADPDGTTLWVAKAQTSGKVTFYRFTAADPAPDLAALEQHSSADDVGITLSHGAFYVGNGDFGAKRFALMGTYAGQYQIKVFNPTSWVEDLTQSWFNGWWAGGMIFDGGVFKTLDYSSATSEVYLHYQRVGSTSSSANTVRARHAWWDNNGTDGNKESAASPTGGTATKILPMREWPTITVPPPPNTGSADNPANSVRVYLGQTAGGEKLHQTIEPAAGQQIISQTTIVAKVLVGAGTETPKASTTFPAAASSGAVQAIVADAAGALARLKGDGSWRFGDLRSSGSAGRFEILKTGQSVLSSGTYTGTLDFVRIGQMVFCTGYSDRASGFNASSHDTGHRIPSGFRPPATVVGEGKAVFNATGTYRYRFLSSGIVELQQSAAIGQFQVADAFWITNEA